MEMKKNIVKECIYEHSDRLLNLLESILIKFFNMEKSTERKFSGTSLQNDIFSDLRLRTKLIYNFFQKVVKSYNAKHKYLLKKFLIILKFLIIESCLKKLVFLKIL